MKTIAFEDHLFNPTAPPPESRPFYYVMEEYKTKVTL